MRVQPDAVFVPLNIAVLTVSDTRTYDNDTSGELLASRSVEIGHRLVARALLKDDLYKIRAQVATWIADEQVQVVLITGGTGFTGRDSTPEAVECLLDKRIDGFGELFRPCRFSISAPRPCRAGRWPGCPTARWCAACRAPPGPAVRRGRASWRSSWMRGTGRATSSST